MFHGNLVEIKMAAGRREQRRVKLYFKYRRTMLAIPRFRSAEEVNLKKSRATMTRPMTKPMAEISGVKNKRMRRAHSLFLRIYFLPQIFLPCLGVAQVSSVYASLDRPSDPAQHSRH